MSLTDSKLAYNDCYDIFDKAVADEQGVRVAVDSRQAGQYLRMRLHKARQINRNENRITYPRGHPLYGLSQYDKVVIRVRSDGEQWWVYLEQAQNFAQIENLSTAPAIEDRSGEVEAEFEEVPAVEAKHPLLIEHIRRRV